ncbi:MAG: hypothetical protein ACFE0I_10315 [Elainellaceae cyanobacterium]
MNGATKQLQETLDSGWSVQIYGRDRRLLLALDPSHGWTFLAGIVLGFIVALAGLSGQSLSDSSRSTSSPMSAPLNLD